MPLDNSRFRIIHRLPTDPHGVEGYFIHEIYTKAELEVTGWRAGVSIGHLEISGLKRHMIRVIEAFNHESIQYRDLSTPGFKLPTEDGCDTTVRHTLLEQIRCKPLSIQDNPLTEGLAELDDEAIYCNECGEESKLEYRETKANGKLLRCQRCDNEFLVPLNEPDEDEDFNE